MNLTEKLNHQIEIETAKRVAKEVDRLFKPANQFLNDHLPESTEAMNEIVAQAIVILQARIREEVEAEIIERLAAPTKVIPKIPFDLDELKRRIEEAGKNPWTTPPWPIQPQPLGPYRPPFGPVWCGGKDPSMP